MSAAGYARHPIPPVFDENSRILILGSFPSVRSREAGFFYAHPRNRFWTVLSAVLGAEEPADVPAKKTLLLENHIALWDAAAGCEITGSSDASLKNASGNDLSKILSAARIRRVYTNGATAQRLYHTLCEPGTGIPASRLPSTSPANASFGPEELIAAWSVIREAL